MYFVRQCKSITHTFVVGCFAHFYNLTTNI